MNILHTPDDGSTACVQLDGPLGNVYIQALDAYGYQRELSLKINTDEKTRAFGEWIVSVYQHPGRRDYSYLTAKQAKKFITRLTDICERYPHFLFNRPSEDKARCCGFIHLCEDIHGYRDVAGASGWLSNI